MSTWAEAKLDPRLLLCRSHACATAKLESQRTAGSKTPGKGAAAAGRSKLLLCCCRIQETPGAPEDTRGIKEGHQGDRRAETPRGPEGIGRDDTKRGPEGTTGGLEQAARPQGSNRRFQKRNGRYETVSEVKQLKIYNCHM
jgi:hypothetical protein